MAKKFKVRPLIGWREWAALPSLGLTRLKVKVDTGARTSALHADAICVYKIGDDLRVCFVTADDHGRRVCKADLIGLRWVTDSGGSREHRYVIKTVIAVGQESWPIELTLTGRHTMKFPMLLGRRALARRFWVNPARSFLQGPPQLESSAEQGLGSIANDLA